MGECSICLDSNTPCNWTLFKCNHQFHNTCIYEWMKLHNTCPNCRELIKLKFFVKLHLKHKCFMTRRKKTGAVVIFGPECVVIKYFGAEQMTLRYPNITSIKFTRDRKIKFFLKYAMKNQDIIKIEFESVLDQTFAIGCIRHYINNKP